jgi:hypothetical protein
MRGHITVGQIVTDHAELIDSMTEIRDGLVEYVSPPIPSPFSQVNCSRPVRLSLREIIDRLDDMIDRAAELQRLESGLDPALEVPTGRGREDAPGSS